MNRFFNKVNKTESCWIWSAAIRGKSGYGCFNFNGKTVDAHRVSFILAFGNIPIGYNVCHICDNRLCVNPNHLFLGTQKDNMIDCLRKGRLKTPDVSRFKKGNKPSNALLSKEEVDFAKKQLLNRGKESIKSVANRIGINYQTLRDINCKRIYKDNVAIGCSIASLP